MCFKRCDKCLKGRENKCCGCVSTKCGIHLISLLTMAELTFICYIFSNDLVDNGVFSIKLFSWLAITMFRTLIYISMFCCDSISKRRLYMWTLFTTTCAEIVMFTILQVGLFNETSTEDEALFHLIEETDMSTGW